MTRIECASCDFWNSLNGKQGACHRYPPTVRPQIVQKVSRVVTAGQRASPPQVIPVVVRVRTMADDFCGEHQASPE